ncbi:hypothetical protein BZG01_00095 [Labilibaculum manganireducens]|uniref:Uncharacterized protein n=1 Tax=Labilibaculum manganireducens TaxID=1940525 RepID=A0A2N3IGK2_9BACT|nr:hypothetical protein [Labilibaculum manganireducens]PKQ69373.1 hypothetical protein BZG01_00095 [Labilibaculum manganireducens]
MLRKLFKWIFKDELQQLEAQIKIAKEAVLNYESQEKRIKNVLQNIDVSVDVHEYHKYSPSWACISLQGVKSDYIKFIDLKDADIHHISSFLRRYERDLNIKVDASPHASGFLRIQGCNHF